jgi:transcriptional regulator with XRE-family HTH domain
VTAEDLRVLADARADAKSGRAREIRIAADVSQAEIAKACGVATSAVSQWENGQRTPRGDAALRYGRALRMLANGSTRREAA